MKRKIKGLVYFFAVLGILIIGTLIVFRTQSEKIAIRLGDYVTSRYARERNLSIEVGNIGGSLLHDIRLEDLCISYTGGEAPRVLLSAPEVYGKFNLASILTGKVTFDSISVESAKLIVPRRSDGSFILPTGDAPVGPEGKRSRIEIRRIGFGGGSVVVENAEPRMFTDVDVLGSYFQDAQGSTVNVDSCSFTYGKAARIDRLAGKARATDDRIHITEAVVKAPNTRLALSGFLGVAENDSVDIEVVIDSLDVGEAALFYGGTEESDMGGLSGRISARGRYSDLSLRLDLDGAVDGWIFEGLMADASYTGETLTIEHLSSVLNKTRLDLSGEYRLSAIPQYEGIVAFSDLDISEFINDSSGEYSSDLSGSIRFRGRGVDSGRFRLETWPELTAGRYGEWVFDSVRGKVEWDAESVVLDGVQAELGRARLGTDGTIGFDGDLGLGFTLACPRLEDIEAYHKLDGLVGSVVGTGKVERKEGVLGVSLASTGRHVDYKGSVVDSVVMDLDLIRGEAGFRGRGQVFASRLNLSGFKATEFIGDMSIEDHTIALERLVFTRESEDLLGAVGVVDMVDGGVDIAVENLFVELGGFIWENTDTITAAYRQDSLSVSDFELFSGMGRVSVFNSSYVRGSYIVESHFDDFDLGMLRKVLRTEIPTGLLALAVRASGSADSLTFDADFGVSDGRFRSVPFETLGGALHYDGAALSIDGISLAQNGASVTVEGMVPMDLRPRRISELARAGKIYDIVGDLGNVTIEATDIDISLMEALVPPLAKLQGYADMSMEITGSTSNPRFLSSGKLRQAAYDVTQIGEITWDLDFQDSVLAIKGFTFEDGRQMGSISGEVPIAISILPFESELLTRSIDVAVHVENGDMGLMCSLFPRFRVCSGRYDIDLGITGTVADPLMRGYVRLSDTRLRLAGVAQDIRNLSMDVEIDGKRFEITRLVAEEGALRGVGFLRLTGTRIAEYDIDLTFKDYSVTEFDNFYAKLGGNLSITTETFQPGEPIPKIEGSLTVREGEYFYSMAAGGGAGAIVAPSASPGWVMNVAIEVPNDFWIRGDDIEAELQGDVSVKRGKEGLLVLGSLRTLRGRFYVYHNSFRITRGEFRFSDVTSLKNAYIDLEAESRVLDEKITLLAKGYMDRLDVSATSESGWSETQIFEALTLRRGTPSDETQEAGFFSGEFLRSWGLALVNRFGDDVARELHLDQFGIEVGDLGEGEVLATTRLTFGKYVSDKVYLEYTQSLGSLYGDRTRFTQRGLSFPERQLSVEYRFSNRFSIEGETGTVGGLGYFDVDLKFRFGY